MVEEKDALALISAMFPSGDPSILEYLAGLVADEDFEWRDDGGFEHLGPFLIDGGCCATDDEARDACKTIQRDLGRGQDEVKVGFRALDQGPVVLQTADTKALTGEELKNGKSLITQPLSELPQISERDKAKIERTRQKEEQQARAAFEAHQAEAQLHLKGALPTIIRNQVGSYLSSSN